MNTAVFVNRSQRASDVKDGLAAKLREILSSVPWLELRSMEALTTCKDSGFDFRVKVLLPGDRKVELWVQCKVDPRPSQFPYILRTREEGKMPVQVFAAPLVAPRMAAVCAEHGWSWFDLGGNCFIDIPGLLRLERSGLRAVHKHSLPAVKLGTGAGDRVVRTLLDPDNAGLRWTQQKLSEHTALGSVSVALVNKIVQHLRGERYVEYLPPPGSGFRLRDPMGLLTAWREAYRFDRHEQRGYFSLLQGNRLRAALSKLGAQTGGFAAYAGFSAAELQAPHVRQPKTWLYLRAQDVTEFEELAEAKEVDSGANIILLVPHDNGVFYVGDGGWIDEGRLACTNLVQTYVDLWHCGGRGKEAAEALLEQRIKRGWKERGLNV